MAPFTTHSVELGRSNIVLSGHSIMPFYWQGTGLVGALHFSYFDGLDVLSDYCRDLQYFF